LEILAPDDEETGGQVMEAMDGGEVVGFLYNHNPRGFKGCTPSTEGLIGGTQNQVRENDETKERTYYPISRMPE
jgi:hypothetical protein